MLDIQLKREPFDDMWSVSISHAAEVLQNWNLIGFQVDIIASYYLVMSNRGCLWVHCMYSRFL